MAFPMPRHVDHQEPVIPEIPRDSFPERTVKEYTVQENHRQSIDAPAFVNANGTQNRFDKGFPARHDQRFFTPCLIKKSLNEVIPG